MPQKAWNVRTAAHTFSTPTHNTRFQRFSFPRALHTRSWRGGGARFLAPPRAPPISSFKIILRPKGHSPLSYPPRQITVAPGGARVAPTTLISPPTTEIVENRAEAEGEPRSKEGGDEERAIVSHESPRYLYRPRLLLDLINNSAWKIWRKERMRGEMNDRLRGEQLLIDFV